MLQRTGGRHGLTAPSSPEQVEWRPDGYRSVENALEVSRQVNRTRKSSGKWRLP